uniref:Uncharacterized protein n=1 Tax=Anguilla anguilla TaxID=7936 RepID=A0A0E9QRD4_ANGAN
MLRFKINTTNSERGLYVWIRLWIFRSLLYPRIKDK